MYLYGSWAKGNATYTSDIDLAVDVGKPINEYTFIKLADKIYGRLNKYLKPFTELLSNLEG